MPGQALVVINEKEWSVSIASTTTELIQGLSGVASIPAGTGMLFDLPARQIVTVDTTQMLFPIDIIFIKDNAVLDIARNIEPGNLVEEAIPIDMFLEVNALEAATVEVGDIVSITITQAPGIDWSSMISSFMPLAMFGIIFGVLGGMLSSGSSSSKKQLGSGEQSISKGYYWEIFDIDTGEIFQKSKQYSHVGVATSAAKEFQRHRSGKDKENLVVIRIFDTPNWEEWDKTIKPVYQVGMRRGIPIEIGKTPLQKEALDRLWPYGIKEIHSDGDLTVSSAGKKYVVTTEGGVFGEEDVLHLGGKMIEIPIKPFGEEKWIYAKVGTTEMRGKPTPEGIEFEQVSPSYDPSDLDKAVEIITKKIKGEQHSIHGEPRVRLVEKYGSWAIGRAEAICPEDDITCVTREAERLIKTIRLRYGEEAMKYIRITIPGKSVFQVGDTVSLVAYERENKRLRSISEKEAVGEITGA